MKMTSVVPTRTVAYIGCRITAMPATIPRMPPKTFQPHWVRSQINDTRPMTPLTSQ